MYNQNIQKLNWRSQKEGISPKTDRKRLLAKGRILPEWYLMEIRERRKEGRREVQKQINVKKRKINKYDQMPTMYQIL